MDTLNEAKIHASGPLHSGSSFTSLFPGATEEKEAVEAKTLEPRRK